MLISVKTYQQLVFTFGVVLFLLRPFLGYLIAGQGGLSSNPSAISQLMQRAVKKKDEHHEPDAEMIADAGSSGADPIRSFQLSQFLHSVILSPYCSLKRPVLCFFSTSTFKIVPDNHWYRRHSLFRI